MSSLQMTKISFAIWPIILGLMAWLGTFSPNFGAARPLYCAVAQINKNDSAADILFLGNSQIASGIDAVFVEELLGSKYSVEKLNDLGPNAIKYILDLEAYIIKRGAPEIVVLNLPINLRSAKENFKTKLLLNKTIKMHKLKSLISAQWHLLSHEPVVHGNGIPRYLNAIQRTSALVLSKISDNIFRSSKTVNFQSNADTSCQRNGLNPSAPIPRRHPHSDLALNTDYSKSGTLLTMEPKFLKRQNARSNRSYPPNLDTSSRFREYYAVRQISQLAKRHNIKFRVTVVPILNWHDLGGNENAIFDKHMPDVQYIDSFQMYALSDPTVNNEEYFRNWNHLNFKGATLLSRFWAATLKEILDE